MLQISLRAARVNSNMNQKEAAMAIGVDVATIINWEKGKTAPKAPQLQELCRIYSIPIDSIILVSKSTLSEQLEGA